MNSIKPKTGAYWNLAFIILSGIAAGTVTFTGVAGPITDMIKSYAADAAFLVSCVNLVFHLYSSPEGGPLTK